MLRGTLEPSRSSPGLTRCVTMIQDGSGRSKCVTTMMSSMEQARSESTMMNRTRPRRVRPPLALTAEASGRVSPVIKRGPSRLKAGGRNNRISLMP